MALCLFNDIMYYHHICRYKVYSSYGRLNDNEYNLFTFLYLMKFRENKLIRLYKSKIEYFFRVA